MVAACIYKYIYTLVPRGAQSDTVCQLSYPCAFHPGVDVTVLRNGHKDTVWGFPLSGCALNSTSIYWGKRGEKNTKRKKWECRKEETRTERGEKRPIVVEELSKDQRGTSSVSRE